MISRQYTMATGTRRSALVDNFPQNSESGRELFEACRGGDLAKVKSLVTTLNVNSRDTAGRKSTPLHFAAGMNVMLFVVVFYYIIYYYSILFQ